MPASIRADILAEVAAAIADAQSQRAQAATDIADMKADFATARSDAANGIAQMKADVATAVDEARTATIDALAAEKNTATQALSAQTASLKAELAELVASTDKDRKKFVADDAKAQQDAADAVGTMQADVQRALSTLDQGDDVLAQEKSRSQHDLAKLNAVRAGAWDEYVIDVEARIAAIIAAAQYEQALADLEGALQGSARMKAEWIRENLGEAAYRQHLEEKLATLKWGRDATSYLLSVLPGTGALLDLTTGVTGEDINGDTVGGGERALAGISAFGAAAGLGATDEVFDGFRAVGKTRKRTANLVDKAGDIGGGVRKAPRGPVSPRHFADSPDGIRLFEEAKAFRGQLPGSAAAKQYRNIAVADVIVDGQRRTVRFANTPKGLHSEERLIQWYDILKIQQGRDVKVLSVFSDRIPCGTNRANCVGKLGEAFGQHLDVFFNIFKGPIR